MIILNTKIKKILKDKIKYIISSQEILINKDFKLAK